MKTIGWVIVALDILLVLIWFAGGIYSIVMLEQACFEVQLITHFLILIHFALGFYLASMVGEIDREQQKAASRGRRLIQLPYLFYLPLAWIFVSVTALAGDVLLLTAGIRIYLLRSREADDGCQTARFIHILFDSFAVLICLITIVWFIVFSLYTIKERRRIG